MEITILHILLAIWFSFDKNIDKKPGMLALYNIVAELCLIFNFIVMLVYWSIIHHKEIHRFMYNNWVYSHMYIIHLTPALSFIANFGVSNYRIVGSYWKFLAPLGVVYCIINYLETLKRGEPLYWFITWEDYKTPLLCAAMIAGFSVVFVLLAGFMNSFRAPAP